MRHRPGLLLFALVWLVILALPETRLLLRVQARGSPFMHPRMQFLPAWLVGRDEFRPRDLAARFPNDPYVLALAAEISPGYPENQSKVIQADYGRKTVRNIDALIVRFPNEPWLIARRLQRTTLFLNDDRLAKSEKEDNRRHPKPDPIEVATALQLAEQGARLEPDNSYFDWYRIWLLLTSNRDQEAVAALHNAARKPRYDSYHREAMRIEMAADRWRPPVTEEKVELPGRVVFPEFAKQRQVARLLVDKAADAENAGDHARALTMYGDLMRLSARMRKNSYSIIELLVAVAMENIARSGGGTPRALTDTEKAQINNQSNSRDRLAQLYATRFSDYATAHRRADLAREAQHESAEAAQSRTLINKYLNAQSTWGIAKNQYLVIYGTMAASGLLLTVNLVAALVWCVVVLMLRGTGADGERVPWREVGVVTLISVLVAGVGMGGVTSVVLAVTDYPGRNWSLDVFSDYAAPTSIASFVLAALFCWFFTRRRFRGVFWRQRRLKRTLNVEEAHARRRRQIGIVAVIYLLALILRLWVWLDSSLSLYDQMFADAESFFMLFFVTVFTAWLIRWRWFMPDRLPGEVTVEEITDGELRRADRLSPRRAALWGLVWYRQSIGAFVVLTSLLYLTLTLGSLPHRRLADAKVNQMLQHGELAVALGKVK